MKSCSGPILNDLISGIAMITLGLPPNFAIFASKSPNVHETESLPGITQCGPTMIIFFEASPS